jgi:hypothetical protein
MKIILGIRPVQLPPRQYPGPILLGKTGFIRPRFQVCPLTKLEMTLDFAN